MEIREEQPLLSPLMRWFLFAMVLANIAGGMLPMLLPLYLQELGASVAQIGLVFTITSVVVLTLQIFGGWVSDSIGRLSAAESELHWITLLRDAREIVIPNLPEHVATFVREARAAGSSSRRSAPRMRMSSTDRLTSIV